MVFTLVIDIIFQIVNYNILYKKYQIYVIKQKLSRAKDYENEPVLQCEVNEALEGIYFDLEDFYQSLFKVMFFCLFFQTLTPYVMILGIIYLIALVLIEKFDVIYRYNKPRIQNF